MSFWAKPAPFPPRHSRKPAAFPCRVLPPSSSATTRPRCPSNPFPEESEASKAGGSRGSRGSYDFPSIPEPEVLGVLGVRTNSRVYRRRGFSGFSGFLRITEETDLGVLGVFHQTERIGGGGAAAPRLDLYNIICHTGGGGAHPPPKRQGTCAKPHCTRGPSPARGANGASRCFTPPQMYRVENRILLVLCETLLGGETFSGKGIHRRT